MSPYVTLIPLPCPPLPIRYSFKLDIAALTPYRLHASRIQPPCQILTLTDIEELKISAAFNDGLNPGPCDTHTAADGKLLEFEEM